MKNDISNIMSKLTVAELGKLKLKDDIGSMLGKTRIYSEDDFDIALSKQDRSNKVRFFFYECLFKELMIIYLTFQGIVESINKRFLIINGIRIFACWSESIDLSRQMITVERMNNHYGDDPGDNETWLRNRFIGFNDELINTNENISTIYDNIKESIIQYLNYRDLIKGMADRLGLPELEAIIGDDALSDVETLNMWAVGKNLKSPLKKLFQEIDIEELEQKKRTDIQEKIKELMTWVED